MAKWNGSQELESIAFDANNRLSAREEVFANLVAQGLNLTDAARKAGYADGTAEHSANRIAENPRVARRIAFLRQAHIDLESAPIAMPKSFVLQRAYAIVNRAMQAEPVLDNRGNPIGTWVFDAKNALKGLEFIANVQGYIVKNIAVHGDSSDLGDLSRDELIAKTVSMIMRSGIQREVLEGLTIAVGGERVVDIEEAEIIADE